MFLQLVIVVLFTTLQHVLPQSSQPLPFAYLRNQPEAKASRVEDTESTLTVFSTRPLILSSNKQLNQVQENLSSPEKKLHLFGNGLKHKRRRDVPNTSYSRSGDDGETVYIPSLPREKQAPPDTTEPGDETFDDDGETTYNPILPMEKRASPDTIEPGNETFNEDGSFSKNSTTDNGIFLSVLSHQKPLPLGEQKKAMEGQYSYRAPDGTTFNTTWTADEIGFSVKVPNVPTFGLGFGRRR